MKKEYEKKWLTISVIFLFTGITFIPSITANTGNASSAQQDVDVRNLLNNLESRLDKVTTKKEAIALFKEAVVELNKYGLLPKGMSVKQAQRLVTNSFLKSELLKPYQRNNENNTGNTNCLVIGIANETYFRPYPALVMDIPFLHNLAFNHSGPSITTILAWPYLFRVSQPLKFGPYAYVGARFKVVEHGNTTHDRIDASSGWVWTIGSNGFKKWNGTFYGGLYTKYEKFVNNNYSYGEAWDPVGIRGFVGINFFNFISSFGGNKLPSIYIGFAREVNFTYSPPWT
jgi:hypothetical protein